MLQNGPIMKSIACINCEIPTIEAVIQYQSKQSLRDYDIVIFDPKFPYLHRIEFSGGGSCVSIESMEAVTAAMAHWRREMHAALEAGKTVFVLLNEYVQDSGATGSTMTSRTNRTYNASPINNYTAIPAKIVPTNATGRRISVKDGRLRSLYEAISGIASYRVVLASTPDMKVTFSARDGAAVGGIVKSATAEGSLVLLPHFKFPEEQFIEQEEDKEVWTEEALQIGHALVAQFVAIDKTLKASAELTPPPNWIVGAKVSQLQTSLEGEIATIDAEIDALRSRRETKETETRNVAAYSHLLYETGKPLERAIEMTLRLLDYSVETLTIDDLEIDHVIVGPSGKRMIGEAEGKDTSAIDIGKFRQLLSNIQEDFNREEIETHAKGVLFGNGHRLTAPDDRPDQFTKKCLKNAQLHGTALIRTADLYPIAIYLLDHPRDEKYKAACRAAIEDTEGAIIGFPKP